MSPPVSARGFSPPGPSAEPSSGAAEPDSAARGRCATGYGASARPSAAGAQCAAPRVRPAPGPRCAARMRWEKRAWRGESPALSCCAGSPSHCLRALRVELSARFFEALRMLGVCLFRIYEHKHRVDPVLNIFFTFALFWSISIFKLCLIHNGNKYLSSVTTLLTWLVERGHPALRRMSWRP